MRIIVTGSRDWADPHMIRDWMLDVQDKVGKPYGRVTIVHGAARGADRIAAALACRYGFTVEAHPADWSAYGRAAGPVRNVEMLRSGVDAVVAFKDGFDPTFRRGGTEHMIDIARRAGVAVELHSHDGVALPLAG